MRILLGADLPGRAVTSVVLSRDTIMRSRQCRGVGNGLGRARKETSDSLSSENLDNVADD